MAVLAGNVDGKPYGRVGSRVVRAALAIGGDLGVVEFRGVLDRIRY